MISKQDARKIVKEKRQQLSGKELIFQSRLIAEVILNSEYYSKAEVVFCYASVNGEVDTFYLMEKVLTDGKMLALPVTEKKNMEFYRVESLESLKVGYMGIPEPEKKELLFPGENDIMIMPGVAFDTMCHRAGYGAGCYDRYLKSGSDFLKVAPAFPFQLFEEIENDELDICPDILILSDGRKFLRDAY